MEVGRQAEYGRDGCEANENGSESHTGTAWRSQESQGIGETTQWECRGGSLFMENAQRIYVWCAGSIHQSNVAQVSGNWKVGQPCQAHRHMTKKGEKNLNPI